MVTQYKHFFYKWYCPRLQNSCFFFLIQKARSTISLKAWSGVSMILACEAHKSTLAPDPSFEICLQILPALLMFTKNTTVLLSDIAYFIFVSTDWPNFYFFYFILFLLQCTQLLTQLSLQYFTLLYIINSLTYSITQLIHIHSHKHT